MISGKKIFIRGINKEDAKDIYAWVNKETLRYLTGTLYPVSEYEHEVWIKKQVEKTDNKLFVVCDKKTKNKLGTIRLKHIDYVNRNAELFISLGEEENWGGIWNRCCFYFC